MNLNQEVEHLVECFNRIPVDRKTEENTTMTATAEHLRVLIDTAIVSALRIQRGAFEKQLEEVKHRFDNFTVSTSEVETYKEI